MSDDTSVLMTCLAIVLLYVAVLTFLIPFFILRIRNEIIKIRKLVGLNAPPAVLEKDVQAALLKKQIHLMKQILYEGRKLRVTFDDYIDYPNSKTGS